MCKKWKMNFNDVFTAFVFVRQWAILDILKKRVHTKLSMILPYCCLLSSSFCCPCCHHHLCHWEFSAGCLDSPALSSVLNRSESVWWSCLWRRSRVWLVENMLASHRDQVVNIAKIKQSNKQWQEIAMIHLLLNCTNFNKVKMSLILKKQRSKGNWCFSERVLVYDENKPAHEAGCIVRWCLLSIQTFINSNDCGDILVNFFSSGEISLTSGSRIPTNNGFLRNTSLCLGVKLPKKDKRKCPFNNSYWWWLN